MRYLCDWLYAADGRCNRPAVIAVEADFGSGAEHRYLCVRHQPQDWNAFDCVYHIKNDELIETGITKQRREPIPVATTVGVPIPKELIKEAVARYWEKRRDQLILHSLGVRLDD